MKPFLLLNHPNPVFNCEQVNSTHSMGQPQMLPQVLGLRSSRIALPLDLAKDNPIYINAKQYHGILRRRQSRAKIEAQNKLIKNCKI
ncbi:hypothetical protein Ahy_B05g076110 [Arachis hypogaea]|uniref:Nuclear transcription factor Y subunit n=1 Tax=Arachis hypogaea TaxID=3818 RepID=A0A444Z2P1_ARAHY|nr:hypothetical protein Ahy_B05g076110 [Arachis hypogaea]